MRISQSLRLLLLGTTVLALWACKPRSDSALKNFPVDPPPQRNELTDAKVEQALNSIGADRPGFSGEARCAGACHTDSWHGVITKTLVLEDWAQPTLDMKKCFDRARNDKAKIDCFKDGDTYDPKKLGVYRAGAKYKFFRDMFRRAYPNRTQFNREYAKFIDGEGSTPAAVMPTESEREDAARAMSEADFDNLIFVYTHENGLEKMAEKFNNGGGGGETMCTTNITPAMKRHINNMEFDGWGPKNLSEGIKMYGCKFRGDFDPLLSPLKYCFGGNESEDAIEEENARWNRSYNVDWAKGWDRVKGPDGRFLKQGIRILSDFQGLTTTFWMRSSADGRFVGNGLGGGSRIDGQSSARGFVIDLQDNKVIAVDAPYDPGFFPDNEGFTFISNGAAHFCSQKLLLDQPGQPRRDFINLSQENQFCTDGRLSVYQHVGASLTSSDHYYVVRSDNYANDDGGNSDRYTKDPDVGKFARDDSKADMYRMCRTSSCSASLRDYLEREDSETGEDNFNDNAFYGVSRKFPMKLPFEGDFGISPSGVLLTSRIANSSGDSQLGYRIRSFKLNESCSEEDRRALRCGQTEELATICMKGGKASISFNERMIVTHHFTDESDWQEFNKSRRSNEQYSGANDPNFKKLVRNSANIYMSDMMSGNVYRITDMKPGQFALYPHFRSDGWLYYLVRDKNQNKDFLVATDAAIRIQKE